MSTQVVAGLAMLAILVVTHETGHFVFAKLFGIGVPVYSIGMGPRLFGFRWRGTDYRLSMLPVGGYVRMAGADPFGEEDPDDVVAPEEDFMRRPVWQRLLVMLGGPMFNLILPLIVMSAVLMGGEPVPDNVIGTVQPGSIAESVGLQPRDRVLEVGGARTVTWTDVAVAIGDSKGPVELVVARGPERLRVTLDPAALDGTPRADRFGLFAPRLAARVGVDDPTSPAGAAGLVTGDQIVALDGKPIDDWLALEAALAAPVASHAVRYARPDQDDPDRLVEADTVMTKNGWRPRAGEAFPNDWGVLPSMLFIGFVEQPPAPAEGWRGVVVGARDWLLGPTTQSSYPAFEAGLRPGDRLWSADGQPIRSWPEVVSRIAASVGAADPTNPDVQPRPVVVEVIRGGQPMTMTVTPRLRKETGPNGEPRYRPLMGIMQVADAYVEAGKVRRFYPIAQALPLAAEQSWGMFSNTVGGLRRLILRDTPLSEGLGGPIQIFRMAGQGFEAGVFTYFRLIAVISVSLGVINLLPVPALDGGQITLYLLEAIRGRRLSDALRERVQIVGVLALVALMLAVMVFDLDKMIRGL